MPVLQIVGVTSTEKSFSVGFALLGFEREDNYTWVLEILRDAMGDQSQHIHCFVIDREEALMKALRVVFHNASNLICRWHISKGLTNRDVWEDLMNAWNKVVNSEMETEFVTWLDECRELFSEDGMNYIMRTWLDPHKKRFVKAWTNSVFHIGITSTSRVEGMHYVHKNCKRSGVGDIVSKWDAGMNMVDQEVHSLKASFEQSIFLVPVEYKDEMMFQQLNHNISHASLDLLFKEMTSHGVVTGSQSECGCRFRKINGLPCIHEIAKHRLSPGFIPLTDINVHWKTLHIDGPPPSESQLDYKQVMNLIEERLKSVSD